MAKGFKIQGYNYTGYGTDVYGTQTSGRQLDLITRTGANSVAIIPEYYQNTLKSNDLFATNITPDDSDVIAGIEAAHERGLDVLLNPHIDTLDNNWRAFLDPTNPEQWFESYKAMEVHYAEIAEQTGVESFSVGCELRSMTVAKYRSEWLDVIEAVREVYHGDLTYAAVFDEARTLSFWDKLDTIGVDGYFPLSAADKSPTLEELNYSWVHPSTSRSLNRQLDGKSPIEYLEDLSEQYGKHVVLTECGFRAIDGAVLDPGDFSKDGVVDEVMQARLFKSMFQAFASQGGNWFDGFYIWDWRSEGYTEPKDYHTQGRAAQTVVNLWYGVDDRTGIPPDTGMSVYGTVRSDRLVAGIGGTRLLAGDGDDMVIGGDGNDVLVGGIAEKHAGGQSMIALGAYADMLDGTGATFRVLVNGRVVGKGEATAGHAESWDIDQFAFRFDTPKAFDSIKVVFTNDDFSANEDRNLYVSSMMINGTTIDLADADNSQNPHSGTLYAAGAFSVDLGGLSKILMPASTDRDILQGGLGHDRLTGGADRDQFVFGKKSEIAGDVITDFSSGIDVIDLHRLDANADKDGNQDFDWIGKRQFTGDAGDLRFQAEGKNTVLSGDLDGDRQADFELLLSGHIALKAGDIML